MVCLCVSAFDWSKWRAVGAYAALPVFVFIAFAIFMGVARLREAAGRWWLGTSRCGCCWRPTGAAYKLADAHLLGAAEYGNGAAVPARRVDIEMVALPTVGGV